MAPHLQLVRPVTGALELNVWVADQRTLQIEVAVKFAPLDATRLDATRLDATRLDAIQLAGREPPEDPHRFLRQARCAAKIADPHLVQILEQGRVKGGIPFIVTELLEGKSLGQRLLSGPLSISHAQAVLSQAAGVLAKAHPLGLWHGSLCPEHLFLIEAAGAPFLKLANFGDVSQLAPDASSRRQAYSSPEQLLHGTESSAAADSWSLGVLLYELLTTTLPFEAPTSDGVRLAICNAQFSPPSHYRADLPPAVDAWFSRVFAKEQNARLLDPVALAREFARAIGEPRGTARSAVAAAAVAADVSIELDNDYDGDERTIRWELPPDWSLPQEPERPSALPSNGPPPLPDRPPSTYPPAPYLGQAPAPSFRVPPPARLPSLPPHIARAALPSMPPPAPRATTPPALSREVVRGRPFALRYRFSKGHGWAAGALLGGVLAFWAWGIASGPRNHHPAPEARTRDETQIAPLAASAAPRRSRQPSDNENLPVILQTDELPRVPEETNEGTSVQDEGTSRAAPSAPKLVKPKTLAAPPAPTPRREPPQQSAKQASPSADCNPPYFFDKNNIRRLKLECL